MKPARVLIVDDSSVMRKIVGRSLRQAGLDVLQVLEASNGSEALSLVRENPLDLILSDINMPLREDLRPGAGLRALRAHRDLRKRFHALLTCPRTASRSDLGI
jgi:CheY-like chemotaxis protein